MFQHPTRLAAKVAAVNRANQEALILYDKLIPIFQKFIGHSVIKQNKELLAKIKKLLPEFPRTVPLLIYQYSSDYSLMCVVKTCEMVASKSCEYYEANLFIGELSNGVLTKLCEKPNFKTYNEEEVLKRREEYQEAKQIADKALDNLYPFKEYD